MKLETDPLIRGDRALSSSGELVRTPAAPPPSDAGCLRKATRLRSGARPPTAHARSRMLPALPRAQALHRRRPRSLVLRARGLRCCAAPPEAVAGAGMRYRRMLQRGARRPPQSTRARIPQKFGSGSVGSEMQPKHRFTEPRANKHAQALTQTSPRPALAAADPGRGRPRKSPGPGRGRCPRLKVQGVAARDRPLKGATSKGKLELQEGESGVSNNISSPEEMKTEGKAIEYSSWMHGGIVSLDRKNQESTLKDYSQNFNTLHGV
ncbi:uncharacterized protein LOC111164065 [Delphinapterus leucas]|uniref:Uncharacterized protein LOC111164065 n=1 Tax=Delphinapterus leucas TaxID=9749 RepID=A0A7F8K7Q8_DELLE|nr:uncharacterized protein LOC111164065 [Delphinapterus leucas]